MTTETIDIPAAEPNTLVEELRELDRNCQPGSNKHDRVIVLITACIGQGVNTRRRIIAALGRLGYNRGHVAIVLNEATGHASARHRWSCDESGIYTNLE